MFIQHVDTDTMAASVRLYTDQKLDRTENREKRNEPDMRLLNANK